MDPSTLPSLEAFSRYNTVYVDPGKVDDFWAAFKPVFETTAAAPECVYLEAFEDPAVPGKVTWVANWNASQEWVMNEHVKKNYEGLYKPYDEATEPLFVKPRETRILKREKPFVDGRDANLERTIGENNEGISLHVSVELKPECVEQWWEEWKKIYPPVVAEPECLYFEVFSDPENPAKLSWVENWSKGPEWLVAVQLAKDYYKPYLAATEPMFATPRAFAVLKRKEGLVKCKEANFEGNSAGRFS